ncbi:MAG: tetratricopeptide repeat protein [Acidobacteriia bacterium]|nr:tetratricopeptide repeat protein [Terriglobia bacterium]
MGSLRLLIAAAAVVVLVSCSRDPNIAKRRYLESGNNYFDRGKYKEASIMYRNALQKDLKYGPAHYKLGITNIRLGQLGPAVQELRRAVELLPREQPDHWDAVVKLSEIYLTAAPGKQYLEEVAGYTKELLKRDPNSYEGHRLSADLAYVRATAAFRSNLKDDGKAFLDLAIAEYRKADTVKPRQTAVEMQLARALAAAGDFAGSEQLYKQLIAQNTHAEFAYNELYHLYIVAGKADQAEQILKLAAQNNPKQLSFLTLLASHYYSHGRRGDTVKVLEQIKTHAQDFPSAYIAVGDFYLRMGDYDSAIREYREGMSKNAKQKASYQKHIIEVLMAQGKRDEAERINAEILKADPNDNDARGFAATMLLDKGQINQALTELQSVATRVPNNPVAHYNLGRAHEARGEFEQSRQEYQKAIDLRPDYLQARLALAQLQLRLREWDGAQRSAGQVLAVDKANIDARLIETAALMGEKRLLEAETSLQQLAKAYPNSSDVYYQLGLVNLVRKRYKEADEDFHKSYRLNASNSRGLMGIVRSYVAQNRIDQAITELQAESNKAPQRVDLRIALATAAVTARKFDIAIAQYQAALGLAGDRTAERGDLYLRLGETYRLKGDFANSVTSLEQARKILPESPGVLSTLALALDSVGRKSEARQAYQAALKADPNNGIALNNLAFLLADTGGDLDQALTLAQRAKQLLPNVPDVSDTLGLIYLRKNLSDNAIDIFKDLVTKAPKQSTFRYHLGMALSQKGDKPRALEELQKALKENPSRDELQKIQQLMNRLG